MIAARAVQQPQPPRHARAYTRRGRRRSRLRFYAKPARIAAAVAIGLVPVMIYVLLMGNLTALNYSLAQVTEQKSALVEETVRLDDRIAQLESRDRLAGVAARLHMGEPRVYAVVDVPAPVVAPPSNGIAFLGAFFHR